MLYHLFYPLRDFFFAFNIFQYISFRAVGAAITALFISFLLGPRIIKILTRLQVGEIIRDNGPESHQMKEGTPTMGGALIILAIVFSTILWAKIDDTHIQILLLSFHLNSCHILSYLIYIMVYLMLINNMMYY